MDAIANVFPCHLADYHTHYFSFVMPVNIYTLDVKRAQILVELNTNPLTQLNKLICGFGNCK